MDHSKQRQMIKGNYSNSISDRFPSVLLTLLVGRQEGHRACKKNLGVGGDDLAGTLHTLKLQLSPLTTSIILSANKIQNGHVLVPANSDPSGKWLLKWRE